MRADAVRNQALILDAARAQITEHGSDVSMDQIAKAAGVAVGTLYRHYPTKKDLVQAVLIEFLDTLISWGEQAVASLRPGDALNQVRGVLANFLESASDDQAIKEAAGVLGADYFTPELAERGRVALDVLLTAAAADGDLRAGVTVDDIYLLMTSAPTSAEKPARDRWLEIVMAGISRER